MENLQHGENEADTLDLMPVSVTLNKPDIAALDRIAREGQTNRSALVRAALQDFLHSDRAIKQRRFRPAR